MSTRKALCLSMSAICAALLLIPAAAGAVEPIFERAIIVPLKEAEEVPFTTKTAAADLETVGKAKIACKSSTGKGDLVGPTGLKLSVTFKECESAATKCTSEGSTTAGEIVASGFEGKLGNLKSGSTPGVALEQGKALKADAEFTCGTTKYVLHDGVVGSISVVGKLVRSFTLVYSEKAGVQLFESLFGGTLDTLKTSINGGAEEATGLKASLVVTPSESIEVS